MIIKFLMFLSVRPERFEKDAGIVIFIFREEENEQF
jgi:hypothetical protein